MSKLRRKWKGARASILIISFVFLWKVKWSHYRPGVAQRVGRGIALLFHDRGTRRGWVVNSTPRPHFTPGKDQVRILQEAGWAPGPVRTGGNSRRHRDSTPDRPARSSIPIPNELPGPRIFVETMYNRKLCAVRQLFWVDIASCVRQVCCLRCQWWCQQKPQQTPHALTFSL